MPDKPTTRRDIGIRDVELRKISSDNATYIVNGREVNVDKATEESFLMNQIAQINKDASKAKILGARAGDELKFSMQQREVLEARLRTILAEKRVMESVSQIQERLKIQGQSSDPVLHNLPKDIAALVQQRNVQGIGQKIAELEARQKKTDNQVILDLKDLQKAMAAKTTMRQETTGNTPQKVEPVPTPVKLAQQPQEGRPIARELKVKTPEAIAEEAILAKPIRTEEGVGIIAQTPQAPKSEVERRQEVHDLIDQQRREEAAKMLDKLIQESTPSTAAPSEEKPAVEKPVEAPMDREIREQIEKATNIKLPDAPAADTTGGALPQSNKLGKTKRVVTRKEKRIIDNPDHDPSDRNSRPTKEIEVDVTETIEE